MIFHDVAFVYLYSEVRLNMVQFIVDKVKEIFVLLNGHWAPKKERLLSKEKKRKRDGNRGTI